MLVNFKSGPEKIICMTEESVETLYLLGKEELIAGVSAYVERPPEAKKRPTISAFTHANVQKIVDLRPDLVLGFSDIQKDIARDLIGEGLDVWISNHRSVAEILTYILQLGRLVDAAEEATSLVTRLQKNIEEAQKISKTLSRAPKVYFEEWDEPMISGIQWTSEIIEICGGVDVAKVKAGNSLAKDRIVSMNEIRTTAPDIIFGCWCGKKVDIESIKGRPDWDVTPAVRNNRVYELNPAIFLQPGPALLLDGIPLLSQYFLDFAQSLDA